MASQLREAVDEAIEELRRLMLEAVPDRVQRRVAKTEIGAEVDDEPSPVGESSDELLRPPRRNGDEDDVETVETRAGSSDGERQVPYAGARFG